MKFKFDDKCGSLITIYLTDNDRVVMSSSEQDDGYVSYERRKGPNKLWTVVAAGSVKNFLHTISEMPYMDEDEDTDSSEDELVAYCALCRAKEIQLYGTVVNKQGSEHKKACKLAGCKHNP